MTLFPEPLVPLFELARQFAGEGVPSFIPAADVVVTDDDLTVVMDLPGLKAEDVTIELREDVLTVKGERAFPVATETDGDQRAWQRIERGFGSFERVLRLPAGLDPDTITASMSDGVLTLHIPKPEERKPRWIEIADRSEGGDDRGHGHRAARAGGVDGLEHRQALLPRLGRVGGEAAAPR
jgi:HSP20 family protein